MHGLPTIRRMNSDDRDARELAALIRTQDDDDCILCSHKDALMLHDEYDLFSELEPDEVTELNRAGFDDCTPVDKFMEANGDYIYVTEV